MRRSSWSLGRLFGNFGSKPRGKKRKGVTPPNRRRFAFEPLEERTLLSVCLWTGESTLNNCWNNSQNWVKDQQPAQHVAPVPGDDLCFFGTAPANGVFNDFPAGTSFSSIEFGANDFTLAGNGLTLTDSIWADVGVTGSEISLDVILDNPIVADVAANAELTISGRISGNHYLTKTGPGTLSLAAANDYTGGTKISNGTIKVGDSDALSQSGNGLIITGSNAKLDLNGHNLSVGTVGLLRGSIVNSSTAAATLTGSIYVVLNGTIGVPLGDNSAPLIKCSSGSVTLSGDNDYGGLTTVYAGQLKLVGQDASTVL